MSLYITPSGRVYCPEIGRFLQKDPLARNGENPYTYANNNPPALVDPIGAAPTRPGATTTSSQPGNEFGARALTEAEWEIVQQKVIGRIIMCLNEISDDGTAKAIANQLKVFTPYSLAGC